MVRHRRFRDQPQRIDVCSHEYGDSFDVLATVVGGRPRREGDSLDGVLKFTIGVASVKPMISPLPSFAFLVVNDVIVPRRQLFRTATLV